MVQMRKSQCGLRRWAIFRPLAAFFEKTGESRCPRCGYLLSNLQIAASTGLELASKNRP